MTIYGHGSHLSQWTATILAVFLSPDLRWLHIRFEQHWPRGFRGEVWCPYQCIGKQTWPSCKEVKRQCTTIILATLIDLPSSIICANIQPQGILYSGEDFKVFTIYGHGGHLGQWTTTILAIFHSPNLRRLHMKFEQQWSRGFREVVWNSQHFFHTNVWGPKQMHRKANLTSP